MIVLPEVMKPSHTKFFFLGERGRQLVSVFLNFWRKAPEVSLRLSAPLFLCDLASPSFEWRRFFLCFFLVFNIVTINIYRRYTPLVLLVSLPFSRASSGEPWELNPGAILDTLTKEGEGKTALSTVVKNLNKVKVIVDDGRSWWSNEHAASFNDHGLSRAIWTGL